MNKVFASLVFGFAIIFCSFMNLEAADYNIYVSSDLYNALTNIQSSSTNPSFNLNFHISTINYQNNISTPFAGKEIHFHASSSGTAINFGGANSLLNAVNGTSVYLSTFNFINAYKNGNGGVLSLSDSYAEFEGGTHFENNRSSGSGGAFYVETSSAVFNDETLFYLNVSSASGGGIFSSGSDISFAEKTVFSQNRASSFGGAFYVETSSAVFNDETLFSLNLSSAFGGSIYSSGSYISFAEKAVFSQNKASSSGGAIYALNGSSITFGKNVEFTSNNSGLYGGAFYSSGTSASFGGYSTFSANTSASSGGAFYIYSSSVSFSTISVLNNNTLSNHGGGFFVGRMTQLSFLHNVVISSNTAVSNGGGFYADTNSNITFSGNDTNISSNTAKNSGGGFYMLSGSNIGFEKVLTISLNKAVNGAGFYADANSKATFSGNNTYISSNTASSNGGGFYGGNSAKLLFQRNVVILNNTSGVNGGGFYAAANSSITFSGSNTNISSNTAKSLGGGFYAAKNSHMTFSGNNVYISSNTASVSGGGFYMDEGANISFKRALTVSANKAVNGGGFYTGTGGSLTFSAEALNILNNEASQFGGGIYNEGRDYIFNGKTTISGNKAGMFGGGIYSHNNGSQNFISEAVFENNSALAGGALFLTDGSGAIFSDVKFINNSAHALGGAIFLHGLDDINIATLTVNTASHTVFSGNKAAGHSNAIHIGNNASAVFDTKAGAKVEIYDNITSGSENSNFLNRGAGSFYATGNAMSFFNFENRGNFYMRNASMSVSSDFINSNTGVFDISVTGHLRAEKIFNYGKIVFGVHNNENCGQIYASDVTLGADASFEAVAQDITSSIFRQKVYYLISYGALTGEFADYDLSGLGSLSGISSYLDYGISSDKWIKLFVKGALTNSSLQLVSGMSYNEKQAAKAYDTISATATGDLNTVISTIETLPSDNEKKEALLNSSGYFLANVIASPASASNGSEVYGKIDNYSENEMPAGNGLWAQYSAGSAKISGNDNSAHDYNDTRNGLLGGFDRYYGEKNIMIGVFLQYKNHDIEQGKNTASIESFGGGFYGGIIKENWEIKALLEGSSDNYETKRKLRFSAIDRTASADFNGFNGGFDIEAALKARAAKDLMIKPYLGIDMKIASHSGFTEKGADSLNLDVQSGSYFRTAARAGMGVGQQKSKYSWKTGVEGKYLLTGEEPEIDLEFAGTGASFSSKGAERGKIILGCFAGGSYNIYKALDIFASLNIAASDAENNYYGNIGLRYGFLSKTKAVPDSQSDNHQALKEEKRARKQAQEAEKARLKEEKKSAYLQAKAEYNEKKRSEAELYKQNKQTQSDLKKIQKQKQQQHENQEKAVFKEEKKTAYEQARIDAMEKRKAEQQVKLQTKANEAQLQQEQRLQLKPDNEIGKYAAEEPLVLRSPETVEYEIIMQDAAEKARKAQIEAEIAEFEAQLAAEQKKKNIAEENKEVKEGSENREVLDEKEKALPLTMKQNEEEKRMLAEAKRRTSEEIKTGALTKKRVEEAERQAAIEAKKKEESEARAQASAKKHIEEEEKKALDQEKKKARELERYEAIEAKRKAYEEAKAAEAAERQTRAEEKKKSDELKRKAYEEAKITALARKEIAAEEKKRKAEAKRKAYEEARAAEAAERQTRTEEKKKSDELKRKAYEEEKAAALLNKQAKEAERRAALEEKKKNEAKAKAAFLEKESEKAANKKKANELKLRLVAQEKVRKEEEKAQKEKMINELRAKKAAEKDEQHNLKREAQERAAREKAEYEAAQKLAAAERAAKERAGKGSVKIAPPITEVSSDETKVFSDKKDHDKQDNAVPDDQEKPKDREKESIKLSFVFPQSKLFASNTNFDLTADGIREIWKAADTILLYIESHPQEKFKIYIEGYTDSSGGAEVNTQVALKRAAVVANELADTDIDHEIIEPKGMGAVNFINKSNTLAVENRRVEIKLVQID